MFKKVLILCLIATTLISSCKKDTAVVETGTIRYKNVSTGGYRYEMFLDGTSLGLLNAADQFDKTSVPVGSHIVKGKQYEGYAVYPTVVEQTITVTKGDITYFQFP